MNVPSSMVTFFTVSYAGVTPWILALVFPVPYMICFVPSTLGATHATPLMLAIASACSIVKTLRLFPP